MIIISYSIESEYTTIQLLLMEFVINTWLVLDYICKDAYCLDTFPSIGWLIYNCLSFASACSPQFSFINLRFMRFSYILLFKTKGWSCCDKKTIQASIMQVSDNDCIRNISKRNVSINDFVDYNYKSIWHQSFNKVLSRLHILELINGPFWFIQR